MIDRWRDRTIIAKVELCSSGNRWRQLTPSLTSLNSVSSQRLLLISSDPSDDDATESHIERLTKDPQALRTSTANVDFVDDFRFGFPLTVLKTLHDNDDFDYDDDYYDDDDDYDYYGDGSDDNYEDVYRRQRVGQKEGRMVGHRVGHRREVRAEGSKEG